MNSEQNEAQKIISVLRGLANQAEKLMNTYDDKAPRLTMDDKDDLKALYRQFKEELQAYAKHGTLDKTTREQSELESAYFAPAVSGALNNAKSKVNSTPDGEWLSSIYGANINIDDALSQLVNSYGE